MKLGKSIRSEMRRGELEHKTFDFIAYRTTSGLYKVVHDNLIFRLLAAENNYEIR